jgi:hypothetical protein
MNAPGFTPGPWEAHGLNIHAPNKDKFNEGRIILSALNWNSDGEADARLAASAPQLYEALAELLAAHQRAEPHRAACCSLCPMAADTLKKARGEK